MDIKNMKTGQKVLVGIAAAAALYGLALLVMWIVWKVTVWRGKNGDQNQNQNSGTINKPTDSEGGTSGTTGWRNYPMKWGSGSWRNKNQALAKAEVCKLQKLCNNWVRSGLVVDGIWGDKTEAAVQKLKTTSVIDIDNPTRLETPFADYVDRVQNPVVSTSRVQVTFAGHSAMIAWNNANIKRYKTYSTEPIK